jgi:hypothetical protein
VFIQRDDEAGFITTTTVRGLISPIIDIRLGDWEMNKRNTIKLTSITALAALLLSVVFSGSAIAGPGKGPQSSAAVFTVCFVDEAAGQLDVFLTITDKSSGVAIAALDSVDVQGEQKEKGRGWDDIVGAEFEDGAPGDDANNPTQTVIGVEKLIELDICAGLDPKSKAVNALTTVTLLGKSSKAEYTSRCKDDPATDDGDPETDWDNEAILKIADYPTLCQ